ncbi:MAG: 50S ribosomal protein L25/general stress protein Ctc [Bacteroidales bacterium]|nr:50S ribosomal protein L25/general stress protein Ctc [Bacteroidales bacterium]
MKTISISVKKRNETGRKSARDLRKQSDVPCVIYGGKEVIHFYTNENEFRNLVYSHNVYLVKLDIDGEKHKAIMQEIQFHPVTDKIQHIDFIEIFDDKPVTISIPVEFTGDAIGIKEGGKQRIKRRSLKVRGLPAHLPERLIVDISEVNIGDVIKVGDLKYDNLEILDPFRSMVYAIVSSRVALAGMVIEDTTAEAEEAEEGEEGEEGAEEAEGTGEGTSDEGGEDSGSRE